MYDPLSDRAKRLVKFSVITITILLVVVNTLMMGLVGKNITYTVRLTPPSQQQQLDNASVYYYSQLTIVILGLLLNLSVLANNYIAFNISKKKFKVNLSTYLVKIVILTVFWVGSLIVTIAFLAGGSDYQMDLRTSIADQSTWDVCNTNLCNAATCARLNAYSAAHKMGISYAVLGGLLGIALMPLSYIINSNRIEQLQLLEK